MNEQIDARGLACPQPVIITKKALESIDAGTVTTIVDNAAARDNVITLAKKLACDVKVEQKGDEYHIKITKGGECSLAADIINQRDLVILMGASTLGRGSDELGHILVKSFFYTLTESDAVPKTIIFINSGVKLTTEGSEVLEHLMNLEKRGVEILSCGTCLDFFGLKEKLCVGQVSNMYTILERLTEASKVLNF